MERQMAKSILMMILFFVAGRQLYTVNKRCRAASAVN